MCDPDLGIALGIVKGCDMPRVCLEPWDLPRDWLDLGCCSAHQMLNSYNKISDRVPIPEFQYPFCSPRFLAF